MSKQKSSKKWNVLLAEDDLATRADLLKALLPVANCLTVDSGEKALELFEKNLKKKKPFDFVLLDVTLTGMDGFEVLKTARAYEESYREKGLSPARIVMITAFKDSLMENYNMGWDEFITKPVDTQKLISRMRTLYQKNTA